MKNESDSETIPTNDLWGQQFYQAYSKLWWCVTGLPADDPAVRYVRRLDEVIRESGAHEAWQLHVLNHC